MDFFYPQHTLGLSWPVMSCTIIRDIEAFPFIKEPHWFQILVFQAKALLTVTKHSYYYLLNTYITSIQSKSSIQVNTRFQRNIPPLPTSSASSPPLPQLSSSTTISSLISLLLLLLLPYYLIIIITYYSLYAALLSTSLQHNLSQHYCLFCTSLSFYYPHLHKHLEYSDCLTQPNGISF